jgi:hypothetical protein
VPPPNEWFAPSEGHGMALVNGDSRLLVHFGAFSMFGITVELTALDVSDVLRPRPIPISRTATPEGLTPVRQIPAVYGHTLTPIGRNRLLRYGGCFYGGYHGATMAPIVVEIVPEPSDDDEDVEDQSEGKGERESGSQAAVGGADSPGGVGAGKRPGASAATAASLTRAPRLRYHLSIAPLPHSATVPHCFGPSSYHAVHPLPSRPSTILFVGGLVDDTPHCRVALLDTEVWSWLPLHILNADDDGEAPPGRYGFASAIIEDKLWILGGCDGGDIRRDGTDLRDVHVLDLSEVDAVQGGTARWRPELTRDLRVSPGTFGRETCSVAWGRKILSFGGSTNHMRRDETTNSLYWFDTGGMGWGME